MVRMVMQMTLLNKLCLGNPVQLKVFPKRPYFGGQESRFTFIVSKTDINVRFARPKGQELGFTFVELLVVIAIISATALVVVPNFSLTTESQRLKNCATELISYINQARMIAATRLVGARLVYDEQSKRLHIEIESNPLEDPDQFAPPNELYLRQELVIPHRVHVKLEGAFIGFNPDGTIDGRTIMLSHDRVNEKVILSINNFTGEIRVENEEK